MIHVTMAMTQIFSLGSNKKLAWDWALGEGKRQKLGWNDKKTNKQTNKKQLVSKASEVVDWGSWTPNCLALLANFLGLFPTEEPGPRLTKDWLDKLIWKDIT